MNFHYNWYLLVCVLYFSFLANTLIAQTDSLSTSKIKENQRKGYIGSSIAYSFPTGNYGEPYIEQGRGYEGGLGVNIANFGFTFYKGLGVSAKLSFYNNLRKVAVGGTGANPIYITWYVNYLNLSMGPMYSFSFNHGIYLDFKVSTVFGSLGSELNFFQNNIGVGLETGASVRWNFASKWNASINGDYFLSTYYFYSYGALSGYEEKATMFLVSVGVGYRLR